MKEVKKRIHTTCEESKRIIKLLRNRHKRAREVKEGEMYSCPNCMKRSKKKHRRVFCPDDNFKCSNEYNRKMTRYQEHGTIFKIKDRKLLSKEQKATIGIMLFGPYVDSWRDKDGIVDNRNSTIAERLGLKTMTVNGEITRQLKEHFENVRRYHLGLLPNETTLKSKINTK